MNWASAMKHGKTFKQEFNGYPPAYHSAMNYLIRSNNGTSIIKSKAMGRKVIADALRAVKAKYGTCFARNERNHMMFVNPNPWIR